MKGTGPLEFALVLLKICHGGWSLVRSWKGSGAVVASLIIRAALTTHNKMSTFSEAGISKKI